MPDLVEVKGQLNRPKDAAGNELGVLLPGQYSIRQLIGFARESGWKDVFPNDDDPTCFPFWNTWLTLAECPNVLVSRTGIVAARFGQDDIYRVLQQQWSYQKPSEDSQKYLQVWLADNPYYSGDSTAHNIHRMVARLHCEYTEDCVTTDAEGSFILKEGIVVDHLDTDKSNNSVFNLHWISKDLNQKLRWMRQEDKKRYLDSLATIDKSIIKQKVM